MFLQYNPSFGLWNHFNPSNFIIMWTELVTFSWYDRISELFLQIITLQVITLQVKYVKTPKKHVLGKTLISSFFLISSDVFDKRGNPNKKKLLIITTYSQDKSNRITKMSVYMGFTIIWSACVTSEHERCRISNILLELKRTRHQLDSRTDQSWWDTYSLTWIV